MAQQCELVLVLPRDSEFTGKNFSGLAHIQTTHGIRQANLDADDRSEKRWAKSGPHAQALPDRFGLHHPPEQRGHLFAVDQRNIAHRFSANTQDVFGFI